MSGSYLSATGLPRRRGLSGLLWAASVIFLLSHDTLAADQRRVTEPVMPDRVCATLAPPGTNLQTVLDHCPAGEAVRLTAGRYPSGPLRMPAGVTLWLEKGALLAASRDPGDYDRGQGRCGTLDRQGNGCRPFILLQGVSGGGIVGEGSIDGQGGQTIIGHDESWWQLARRAQRAGLKQNVPRMIELDHARNITLYRVRLRDAPGFHVVIKRSTDVTVWGIVIDTPADARNTDGIDPISSTNVTIANSFIRTGDDNVAIKAGSDGPAQDISLIDNHFYAGHGLSIGSETYGGIRDVLVKNLTLDGTTSGLRIKSDAGRGGLVERIDYQNICLRHNRWPIAIDTRYDRQAVGSRVPVYQHIRLRQVRGEGGVAIIRGYDTRHPLSVTLDGVGFAADARWQIANARIDVGGSGVSPVPPGLSSPPVRLALPCVWPPFPPAAE